MSNKGKVSSWCKGILPVTLLGWSGMVSGEIIDPSGFVEFPRLGSFNVENAQGNPILVDKNANALIYGATNFPGSKGKVEIYTINNGLGNVLTTPFTKRKEVTPNNDPNANGLYDWSIDSSDLFTRGVLDVFPWVEGGTTRMRFIGKITDPATTDSTGQVFPARFLTVTDKEGIFANDIGPSLVLLDSSPPVALEDSTANFLTFRNKLSSKELPPIDQQLDCAPLGNLDPKLYIDRKCSGAEVETLKYYDLVGTEPDGSTGINGEFTISKKIPTLKAFTERYFTGVSEECKALSGIAHVPPEGINVKYFNNGDLGIGRDMHCIQIIKDKEGKCSGETACYVGNFGTVDAQGNAAPDFDHFDQAKQAFEQEKPFAVVAMVERGRMDKDAPNRVFFVVYDYNQDPTNPPLGTIAVLDRKGLKKGQGNKFIPGNCTVCHGIDSTYTRSSADTKPSVTGAQFLPFDLAAFRFFSDDPNNTLSRFGQEGSFIFLNYLIYNTGFGELGEVKDSSGQVIKKSWGKELIDGWYQHNPIFDNFGRLQLFKDDFVPPAWDTNVLDRQTYLKFIAKGCRTCHISSVLELLSFNSLEVSSSQLRTLGYNYVCTSYQMPQAEQTARVLWREDGIPRFLSRFSFADKLIFGEFPEEILVDKVTRVLEGCASAGKLNFAQQGNRQALIIDPEEQALDIAKEYKAQLCFCTTRDCVKDVYYRLGSDLQHMGIGRSNNSKEALSLINEALVCESRVPLE